MSAHHARHASIAKLNIDDDENLYALEHIPSAFDLALNDSENQPFAPKKATDNSLLDPESFCRLSISTISSLGVGRARSLSPYPISITNQVPNTPRTWKSSLQTFFHENEGLFYVSFSQLFGALMNVTTRLLELEGEGMHPFQILFARQGLTCILCTLWLWRCKVDGGMLGKKEVRGLLCVRAVVGFFGIFGMYCMCSFSISASEKTTSTITCKSIMRRIEILSADGQ
jgi:hypothetical protein